MQTRYAPPGEPAARAGRPPHTVGRRMQARYSPPGEPAARAGRPPHTVGRPKCKLDTPHPASPLRGLADLPTRWGGRNANSILPTRRARCAGWPTSPHDGEAKMQTRYSPPGEPAARAGRPPHTVGRPKCKLD